MIDLISKLQQAAEPSRELDAQIYCAIYKSAYADETPEQHLARALQISPQYTSSVDAALTLMRKHYLWQLKQGIGCTAIVWWLESDWDDAGAPAGHSTTYPALALTIANLMARAVEERLLTLPDAGL